MAQDIREMFKREEHLSGERPSAGHKERFEERLEQALPQKKKSERRYWFLRIVAVLVVVFGAGFFLINSGDKFTGPETVESEGSLKDHEMAEPAPAEYRLSDVSPDFRKIENYYLASLNVELAKLEVNQENKALVDSFMAQLAELDKEYIRLNQEILENGLSEGSVQAMISNLQMRLELLYKLKNKINDINQSKEGKYEDREV